MLDLLINFNMGYETDAKIDGKAKPKGATCKGKRPFVKAGKELEAARWQILRSFVDPRHENFDWLASLSHFVTVVGWAGMVSKPLQRCNCAATAVRLCSLFPQNSGPLVVTCCSRM